MLITNITSISMHSYVFIGGIKMENQIDDTKIEEGKILNFLYNIQNRRRINPLYGIFTKEGLAYVLMGYYLFGYGNNGAIMLMIYIFVGSYIYKNKLNYRFYHHDRLYFFHKITEYLEHREKVEKYIPMQHFISGEKDFLKIEENKDV